MEEDVSSLGIANGIHRLKKSFLKPSSLCTYKLHEPHLYVHMLIGELINELHTH